MRCPRVPRGLDEVLGRRQLGWAGLSAPGSFPCFLRLWQKPRQRGLCRGDSRQETARSAAGPWWVAGGQWVAGGTERRCQRARTQRREVLLKVRAATSPKEAERPPASPPSRVTAPWRSERRGWISVQPWVAGPRVGAVVPENSDSTVYRSLQRSTHFIHLTTTDRTEGVAIMPL